MQLGVKAALQGSVDFSPFFQLPKSVCLRVEDPVREVQRGSVPQTCLLTGGGPSPACVRGTDPAGSIAPGRRDPLALFALFSHWV